MKRQIVSLTICIAAAALCLAVAVQSAPKECMKETPDYSESGCREKCKEEANKGQSYCSSFQETTDSPSSTSADNQGSGIISNVAGGGSSGGSSENSGSGGSSASDGSGGSGNSTSSAISVASSLAISASCFILSHYI